MMHATLRSVCLSALVAALAFAGLIGYAAPPSPAAPVAAPPPAAAEATPAAEAAGAPAADAAAADADEAEKDSKDDLPPLPDPKVKSDLEQRLKAVDAAGLNDDDKRRAVEYYQQALESFDVAVQQRESALAFEEQLKIAKATISITREKARLPQFASYKLTDADFDRAGKDVIDVPGPQSTASYAIRLANPLPPYEDLSGEPLDEVEKRAANTQKWVEVYRQDLALMEAEPKRRAQRMADLPRQVSETKKRLKQAIDELAAISREEVADAVAVARRAALTHSVIALEATLQSLDREQRLYEETGDWVKVRRDYFARYVPHKEKRLAMLRQMINERREDLARQQVREAVDAASEVRPTTLHNSAKQLLADAANENKRLAEELPVVAAKLTEVSRQADETQRMLRELETRFERVQEQVSANELSEFSGLMLRQQQAALPDMRELLRRKALRDEERSDVLAKTYDLNDADAQLANLDDLTEQTAVRAGELSDEFRGEVRKLFEARREILASLLAGYEKYSQQLSALDTDESQLIATTDEYASFIAKRVLWIRSCSPLGRHDLRAAIEAFAWSIDPRHWRDAGAALLSSIRRHPGQSLLGILACGALVLFNRPARRRLKQLGEEAEKRNCTKLKPTLHALWLTLLVALPWPAALAALGWSLDRLSESEFVPALSMALRFTAGCLLLVSVIRQLCRTGGVADAHFDWSQACLVYLRRRLRWLTLLGLPLVLWLVGLEVQTVDAKWSASLGRGAFILVMLLMAAVFQRILLTAGSPYRQVILYAEHGWLKPLQLAWRPAIVLLPISLAILAAVGYYYTALQAALRLLGTVGMLLGVLTLGGFTRRWLLMNRRRLAREQAKQRRAQLAAQAEADAAAAPSPELTDELVDLAALSEQTQKLVRTFLAITTTVGVVAIWAEILPALSYPASHLLPGAESLTWGHLGMFLLVLLVTWVSVRDIPALLELVVLQHLPLDSGARYAFTSISRYVLTAIGLSAAFKCIGGEWNKIQWLVAAMSVGLGFGLQEIFANFVSGIILLFERPIRVGDIVTLGDKSGVVNRIRMRATTIVDWDRKEYIVPNKDLVTERLLNWTLTDQMNRIEIIINVAHGAETDRACGLLLEAAREQPHVLAEPSPSAVFEGFSEAGLKLALRCFLPTLEHRGSTIHNLHSTIDRKFRAAGIEVAAPTKEMRVRLAREHVVAGGGSAPLAGFGVKGEHGAKNGKTSAA